MRELTPRYFTDRKTGMDHLLTPCWRLDQADETYRQFDIQTTGKRVFLL